MRFKTISFHLMVPTIGLLGALLPGSASLGDVVNASYQVSPQGAVQFNYRVTHMPDFDQRRVNGPGAIGFPGNGGMYCAPASAINLMAYAANHGYEAFSPGEDLWQAQSNYNSSGGTILSMGVLMNTHATNGTNGAGCVNGYNMWLNQEPELIHLGYYTSGFNSPTFDEMATTAIVFECVISFCYGRYQVDEANQGGDLLILGDRTGGHCVTLTRATRNGSQREIRYRDPADDPDHLTSQSLFTDRVAAVRNHFVIHEDGFRQMSSIGYKLGDDVVRMIDSVHVVMPFFGLSFTPNTAVVVIPNGFPGSSTPIVQQFQLPPGTTLDQVPHPDGLASLQLVQSVLGGPPSLRRFNLINQSSQTVLPSIPGATDLVFGRQRELYILAGNQLHRVDPFSEDPVLTTINPPMPCQAIAFDDVNNQVVLLSVSGRRIYRYPAGLPVGVIPQQIIVPTSIPMAGDGSVIVNPLTNRTWFLTQGSPGVFSAFLNEAGGVVTQSLLLPAGPAPTSVDFDTQGHMFLARGGFIQELQDVPGIGWQVIPNSPWAGIPIGGKLAMARSRHNIDPAIHSGPQWVNIDPAELVFDEPAPDCLGDLNGDDNVNGLDLGMLLAAWSIPPTSPGCGGAVQCYSDLNFDNRVNGLDLGILLAGWGVCR